MSDSNSSFQLDEMFFEADALIAQGKITEAISTLEAILVEDASFGKAYNHLGWIYETKFKDYAKAEEFYKKCLIILSSVKILNCLHSFLFI